ncbi:hypothetical protein ScPMuIL_017700 [Solemya velum]
MKILDAAAESYHNKLLKIQAAIRRRCVKKKMKKELAKRTVWQEAMVLPFANQVFLQCQQSYDWLIEQQKHDSGREAFKQKTQEDDEIRSSLKELDRVLEEFQDMPTLVPAPPDLNSELMLPPPPPPPPQQPPLVVKLSISLLGFRRTQNMTMLLM